MNKLSTAFVLALVLAGAPQVATAAETRGMNQERMQRMDGMMDRAQRSDSSDRQLLMREHMGLMMQQMHEMQGAGERMARGDTDETPQGMMSMMEGRMQAMQEMMNQMLRHQEMMMKMLDDQGEE